MNRQLKLLGLFAGAAVLGHIGLVVAVPHVLMRVVMNRMSGDGAAVNQFQFGDRTTKDSRRVVRPSPDLAYASCVYDLSKGPLLISAAPSPEGGYASLSVFAGNSDNIAALDTTEFPGGIRFVLVRAGQAAPVGERVVESPTDKGIILDRRLAPSEKLFAKVDQARRADSCAQLPG
jgi:uncharacterized membrane protein